MSNRRNRKKNVSGWSTDQDCLLIEKANFQLSELVEMLPYSEDEIINRKRELGLIKSAKTVKRV